MRLLADGRWEATIFGEKYYFNADSLNEAIAMAWQIKEELGRWFANIAVKTWWQYANGSITQSQASGYMVVCTVMQLSISIKHMENSGQGGYMITRNATWIERFRYYLRTLNDWLDDDENIYI